MTPAEKQRAYRERQRAQRQNIEHLNAMFADVQVEIKQIQKFCEQHDDVVIESSGGLILTVSARSGTVSLTSIRITWITMQHMIRTGMVEQIKPPPFSQYRLR